MNLHFMQKIKKYKCYVCGEEFYRSKEFDQHLKTHDGAKRYGCEECGKGFSHSGDLLIHRRVHTGERPYMCEVCGRSFTANNALRKHRKTHRLPGDLPDKFEEDKKFVCKECGARFSRNVSLINHIRKHSYKRELVCCGFQFKSPSSFYEHKRIHADIVPFECEVCGYTTIRKGNMKNHIRTHSGEKPYVCDICGVAYSDKSNLNKHKKQHSGELGGFSADRLINFYQKKEVESSGVMRSSFDYSLDREMVLKALEKSDDEAGNPSVDKPRDELSHKTLDYSAITHEIVKLHEDTRDAESVENLDKDTSFDNITSAKHLLNQEHGEEGVQKSVENDSFEGGVDRKAEPLSLVRGADNPQSSGPADYMKFTDDQLSAHLDTPFQARVREMQTLIGQSLMKNLPYRRDLTPGEKPDSVVNSHWYDRPQSCGYRAESSIPSVIDSEFDMIQTHPVLTETYHNKSLVKSSPVNCSMYNNYLNSSVLQDFHKQTKPVKVSSSSHEKEVLLHSAKRVPNEFYYTSYRSEMLLPAAEKIDLDNFQPHQVFVNPAIKSSRDGR